MRARGVSELAWASRSPVLHWAVGALHLPSRVSCTTDGGQTSWRGLLFSSRRPLAWRGRATGRPRTRTGSGLISLVPVKNICADLVLTARGESNHMLHGTGRRAGPTTAAAVPCAGSRQAGSGRMDAIMPRGRGRGRGFVPPARSFAGRIAQCPTQARTCSKRKKKLKHARTHARHLLMLRLRGRLVHELQLPVALRARPECGWCMLMGYRRRPKFAGFGWRVVEQFHPFRRFCVSIRVFFFFLPTTC